VDWWGLLDEVLAPGMVRAGLRGGEGAHESVGQWGAGGGVGWWGSGCIRRDYEDVGRLIKVGMLERE